ncbi:exported hypothetical protein [Burkholderiales bacterium]|nr:exported hypothetical protein [Burkholderiales bacterium]
MLKKISSQFVTIARRTIDSAFILVYLRRASRFHLPLGRVLFSRLPCLICGVCGCGPAYAIAINGRT